MRWSGILVVVAACGGSDGGSSDGGHPTPDGPTADGASAGWSSAPAVLGGPLQETAVVAVDAKLYVLGGFAGAAVTDAVRVFDTDTSTWSDGPTLPTPAHHITATVYDGTIYALGMLEGLGFTASGRTWAFTPGVDTTWRERVPMPEDTERGAAVAGVVGIGILVAGGFAGGAIATSLAYDPVNDRWSVARELPAARDHACGGAHGGVLYVVGGRENGTADVRDTVFAFNDDAWVERAPMPTGRGGVGCGIVGDELVVVGGEGNPDVPSGVFPQTEAYSITANTWRTLAPMPTPRHGMGAAGWAAALYVPGGADVAGFGAVDTFEVLVP